MTDGPPGPWRNKHRNVSQVYNRLYSVSNPPAPNPDFFGDLRLTVAALQGLIADAIRDGTTLRAIGGGWSLSRAAVTDGRLLDTLALNWVLPLDAGSVVAGFTGDPTRLMLLQCGVTIRLANEILFQRGLALKTSGASNGQTIAGALSTGTHGSRFRFGAIPEYVRGLHLIAGPDRAIWLERASDPILSDAPIASLGAELVRDDNLFNSALVSFGSFGIIHGVLIEAEPRYMLEVWRDRMPIDENLKRVMRTLDFAGFLPRFPGVEPFHFEVVINPYDKAAGAYVTTMYQRPYKVHAPPPLSSSGLGPGDDVLGLLGKVGDLAPALFGPAVNLAVKSQYKLHQGVTGNPGEIFFSNTDFQAELSAEIGIALADTARALDLMLGLPQLDAYPGLLAFRWVANSKATLAFTRFPVTCTIELPAALADRTMDFYNAVWNGFDVAGIPYTQHWGQVNNFTGPGVRRMYGAAVDGWVASRNQLLDQRARAVFTSPFLQQCGLA